MVRYNDPRPVRPPDYDRQALDGIRFDREHRFDLFHSAPRSAPMMLNQRQRSAMVSQGVSLNACNPSGLDLRRFELRGTIVRSAGSFGSEI
jgi:hypothetical protein